jgi:hypothetical protein
MGELVFAYETLLRGQDGRTYGVHAHGTERPDGMWEGWLQFVPDDGTAPVRTERETTQPSRDTLVYWATGLTDPYLDGALLRVLRGREEPVREGSTPPQHAGAVLDPFQVYAEGADILHNQLRALSPDQQRNIIRAYGLSDVDRTTLDGLGRDELAAIIEAAVRRGR